MNQSNKHTPSPVETVVEDIIAELTLEESVGTANLGEDEFRVLELTLGKYLRHKLDQLDMDVNKALRDECIARSGKESVDDADAANVILEEVWKRLRATHKLRIVK